MRALTTWLIDRGSHKVNAGTIEQLQRIFLHWIRNVARMFIPTHLSASSLSTGDVWGSIAALAAFYTVLLIIEMYLMIKFSRLGPSSLHTGKYHFEKLEAARNEETQA